MIAGLGVDIVEIDRMRRALERRPQLKHRLFSRDEQTYCEERGRPEVHYALRFAAKEAVLKALGTGFSGMRFTDVEVVREPSGKPVPRLSGRAAEFAEARQAETIGTPDLLFAVLDVYGRLFDRVLYLRGTSREELAERLPHGSPA